MISKWYFNHFHHFYFLGILTGLLLSQLRKNGILINQALTYTQLSPSFYQPDTIFQYSFHLNQTITSHDLLWLASAFNHLPAWVLLPEFFQVCHSSFKTPRLKNDYLLFAKALLQAGETTATIHFLESCLEYQWPEIPRSFIHLIQYHF